MGKKTRRKEQRGNQLRVSSIGARDHGQFFRGNAISLGSWENKEECREGIGWCETGRLWNEKKKKRATQRSHMLC